MLSHSRNVIINGGNFTQYGSRNVLDRLRKESAPNALYNSDARFDPPKCHPNTRLAVLERIMGWIFGSEDRDALILWLYGPAGAGKSAIMQSIAEKCAALDILLATFFFFRSDATRNHPGSFVATIAYQIATRIPQVMPALDIAIESDPMIFNQTLDVQIQHLIVNPLRDLATKGFFGDRIKSPRLILIDGLDECNGQDRQCYTLLSIARALHEHRLPLIFLVASRPEHHIKFAFNTSPLLGLWSSLVLDDSFLPDDDIRLFLDDSFKTIKDTHPKKARIPTNWPEKSAVDQLVQKSSGQFIYSSVVIKYISDILDNPPRLLEIVMGLRPPRRDFPFAELDALYMHILACVPDMDVLMDILAALIVINEPALTFAVELTKFLDLEEDDVELALAPLSSIITVGPDTCYFDSQPLHITFCHASFSDFLLDKARTAQYNIGVAEYSTRLALHLTRRFNALGRTYYRQARYFESSFRFQFVVLIDLLGRVTLTDALYQELEQLSIHTIWLEVPETDSERIHLMCRFFQVFNGSLYKDTKYMQLNKKYTARMDPYLRREITTFYSHPALKACMIAAFMMYTCQSSCFHHWSRRTVSVLLHVRNDFVATDDHSLHFLDVNRYDLRILLDFLFDPATPNHLCFDNEDYTQTVLRILAFVCRQHPKSWYYSDPLLPAASPPRKYVSSVSAARRRRIFKHERGTGILISMLPPFGTYDIGIGLLPLVLDKCSKSEKLTTFINKHVNNIVISESTQGAHDAISRYLARTIDDGEASTTGSRPALEANTHTIERHNPMQMSI